MKICLCDGCTKVVWGGGYCEWHQWMRKKKDKPPAKVYARMKPKVVLKKVAKPINKVSKKQAERNRKYADRLPGWKGENPICIFPGCGKPTTDCHHIIGRGIHTNNEKFWLPLCRPHHDICKENPKLAKEMKLIETRTISRKHDY